VGLIPDLNRVCGQAWQGEGDIIYLLGGNSGDITLGGSEYLASVHQMVAGKPPRVDFELERQVQAACREGIRQGWIASAHDCAEGGLVIALAECSIAANLGAEIILNVSANSAIRWDEVLFGEGGARIIVSVALANQHIWESYLRENLNSHWQKLGKVGTPASYLGVLTTDNQTLINVRIDDAIANFNHAIARRLKM
jgi:phosphoribosylformylglycinamidine synthase subunit PurL